MATPYLTRFMVHPAPGKVRNITTVIALDISAFLGYCSDIHSRGRNEDGNISPPAPARTFLGVWCVGIRRGGEQAPVASQLAILAGK